MGFSLKRIFVFLVLLLPLGACQYLQDLFGPVLQSPQVSVHELQIVSINAHELKVKVKFLVQNPNSITLEFSNLDYKISLGKRQVAKGLYEEKFRLPSEQNTVIDIPLTINSFEAVQIVREVMRKRETLRLKLTGSVDFHSSLGATRISFEHEREIFSHY